jgi:septal ring factor EnvC (AmiA/AmiB activator)
MNTITIYFGRLCLLVLCFLLPSCKETQEMQKQLVELNQKIATAQHELQTADAKMAEFRPQLPPTLAGDQAVQQLVVQLAASVVAIENEIAQTQASIKRAEDTLAASKQELESLRSKDPR